MQELEKQFDKQWTKYTKAQMAAAQRAPLPRRFKLSFHPAACSIVYIDTQSGHEHSVHPNLAALKPFLEQQLVAGRQRLQAAQQTAELQSKARLEALVKMQQQLLQEIGAAFVTALFTLTPRSVMGTPYIPTSQL
jgi:hypothetical protein